MSTTWGNDVAYRPRSRVRRRWPDTPACALCESRVVVSAGAAPAPICEKGLYEETCGPGERLTDEVVGGQEGVEVFDTIARPLIPA